MSNMTLEQGWSRTSLSTSKVIDTFNQALAKDRLLSRGDRVIVALSGGPDSVALLRLFMMMRRRWGISLMAGHLNHGLRGAVSDRDEAFVRNLSGRWGIPCYTKKVDVGKRAQQEKLTLEEASRLSRYDYLTDLAKAHGAKLATAHTLDDQAETVLMRIIRGTGIRGLGAIAPVGRIHRVTVLRPLLGIRKGDLLQFLRRERLSFRKDRSNLAMRFTRNRIRWGLLPRIKRQYNPQFDQNLAHLAQSAMHACAFIEREAHRKYRRLARKNASSLGLSLEGLRRLHPAVRFEIYHRALEAISPHLKGIAQVHIQGLESLLSAAPGTALNFPHGINVLRTKARIRLTSEAAKGSSLDI